MDEWSVFYTNIDLDIIYNNWNFLCIESFSCGTFLILVLNEILPIGDRCLSIPLERLAVCKTSFTFFRLLIFLLSWDLDVFAVKGVVKVTSFSHHLLEWSASNSRGQQWAYDSQTLQEIETEKSRPVLWRHPGVHWEEGLQLFNRVERTRWFRHSCW